MPIRIVKDAEWTEAIEGTAFKGKHLSGGRNAEIMQAHRKGGVLDEIAFAKARWSEAITGWSDLYAEDGSTIDYAASRKAGTVGETCFLLPMEVQNRLMERILQTVTVAAAARGN